MPAITEVVHAAGKLGLVMLFCTARVHLIITMNVGLYTFKLNMAFFFFLNDLQKVFLFDLFYLLGKMYFDKARNF